MPATAELKRHDVTTSTMKTPSVSEIITLTDERLSAFITSATIWNITPEIKTGLHPLLCAVEEAERRNDLRRRAKTAVEILDRHIKQP